LIAIAVIVAGLLIGTVRMVKGGLAGFEAKAETGSHGADATRA